MYTRVWIDIWYRFCVHHISVRNGKSDKIPGKAEQYENYYISIEMLSFSLIHTHNTLKLFNIYVYDVCLFFRSILPLPEMKVYRFCRIYTHGTQHEASYAHNTQTETDSLTHSLSSKYMRVWRIQICRMAWNYMLYDKANDFVFTIRTMLGVRTVIQIYKFTRSDKLHRCCKLCLYVENVVEDVCMGNIQLHERIYWTKEIEIVVQWNVKSKLRMLRTANFKRIDLFQTDNHV